MFGFFIGVVCLVLLVGVLRHRRHHPFGGASGWGWGGHHHGCGSGFTHGGYGRGPRAALWRVLRRIDATPAQERIFRDEVEGLRETASGLRDGLRASGKDLAAALREETLDRQKLESVYRQHDALVATLRERLSAALGRVHSTLDARQRESLAEVVERGPHATCC